MYVKSLPPGKIIKYILILAFLVFAPASSPQIVRFMVVGDIHQGDAHKFSPSFNLEQTFLYELSLAAIGERVDFVFFTGDLEIRNPFGSQEDDALMKDWRWALDTLFEHNIRVFACRGNSDTKSGDAWEVLFSGDYSFPRNGPENEKGRTYAIEYQNMLFIALDQYSDTDVINRAWLDELLESKAKEHIFAAGHEPAFRVRKISTMDLNPESRDLFWESLLQAGAKAYFCGHDHFYDHAIISYGDGDPKNDIHQIVSGTGKQRLNADGKYNGNNGRWTPRRIFHEKANGYVLVEIDASDVKISWKRRNGPNDFRDGGDTFHLSRVGTATNISKLPIPAIGVFPNPGPKLLTAHLPDVPPEYAAIKLLDISGKEVFVHSVQAGDTRHVLNLSTFKKGIYFIRIGNTRQRSLRFLGHKIRR